MVCPDITPLVVAKNLAFKYQGESSHLFENLSFTLNQGEVLGLAGRNGSGKSTLLELVASLQAGAFGELLVCEAKHALAERATYKVIGAEQVKVDKPAPASATMGGVTMLLQDADFQLIGSTVSEDMLLSAHLVFGRGEEAGQRARHMAERLSLLELWEKPVQHLSYGQKRKLCLGTALLRMPALLVLDEPLSGLDYPASLELLEILTECVASGVALMISTHDIEFFLPIMGKLLLFMGDGRVLWDEPVKLSEHFAEAGVKPLKP